MTSIVSVAIAILLAIEDPRGKVHGDGGRAVGCLQLWPVSVREANRLVGYQRWTLADRYDRRESLAMARVILCHHYRRGYRHPVALAERWQRPYGRATDSYRRRVQRAYNNRRQCDDRRE